MTCISRRRSFLRLHPQGNLLTPAGSANNYYVEVTLAGAVDPATGMFLNIRDIDGLIDDAWLSVAKDLDLKPQIEAATTGIAEGLFHRLRGQSEERGVALKKLRLFESPDFWVDVWP